MKRHESLKCFRLLLLRSIRLPKERRKLYAAYQQVLQAAQVGPTGLLTRLVFRSSSCSNDILSRTLVQDFFQSFHFGNVMKAYRVRRATVQALFHGLIGGKLIQP
jgi:hypothetical protein